MADLSLFDIQTFKVRDLPIGTVYLIIKSIAESSIYGTFQALFTSISLPGLLNTSEWFTDIFVKTNMSLADLIGHVKRAGDTGSLKQYLNTVIVDDIKQSHMYDVEKRLRALEHR